MKTIERDEVFDTVRQFLKRKGLELTEGSYSQTIQKSCRVLVDVINLGQTGIERAKTSIDQKLEQVRQAIHEKTAPNQRKEKAHPDAMKRDPGAEPQAEVQSQPTKAQQGNPIANEMGSSNRTTGAARKTKRPRKPGVDKRPKRAAAKLPAATLKSKKPGA